MKRVSVTGLDQRRHILGAGNEQGHAGVDPIPVGQAIRVHDGGQADPKLSGDLREGLAWFDDVCRRANGTGG